MSSIRILPPQLVNQIAAGEVIERPASVVKELVENSLDAGAGSLRIEVEQGGAKLIRVSDDGAGIARADLAAGAVSARDQQDRLRADLDAVATLGFRGEALPSIASVSRFALSSRRTGRRPWLAAAGGRQRAFDAPCPAPMAVGTSVEVRDLFYNVPARRKFLRTDKTELGHVDQLLTRFALAHAAVSLRLSTTVAGRSISPAADEPLSARRLGRLLGEQFLAHALPVDERAVGCGCTGWWRARPLPAARATCSSSTSTAAWCGTRWSPTRCARPTGTCCTTAGTRPSCCSGAAAAAGGRQCAPGQARGAVSASPGRCTTSSSAPCIGGWPRASDLAWARPVRSGAAPDRR
jgi:DNA mismatch repair protein MutL